jgi:hypothetical protein
LIQFADDEVLAIVDEVNRHGADRTAPSTPTRR